MTHMDESRSDFLESLARLEQCLETPVVPGELPGWLKEVDKACDEVGQLLPQEIDGTHAQLLKEIAGEDMALAPRVEELKETDRELLAKWQDIQRDAVQLRQRATQAEPHEAKLDKQVERLTKQALGFVIAARKQDNALTTWHQEAFLRDRGVAD